MVENNDNIQQRHEDNKKKCPRYNERKQGRMYAHGRGLQLKNRRKRSKKLGRREEERGDGKRKSKDKVENAERKRLMEWIEENGREQTRGRRRGMDLYK
jgi:hypothetical protein